MDASKTPTSSTAQDYDIFIVGIGSLRQALDHAQVTLAFPSDAEAYLEKDAQGYSFTWENCFYGEDRRYPDCVGVPFAELANRVFSLVFRATHARDTQEGTDNGR